MTTIKQIAEELGVSPTTIQCNKRTHRENVPGNQAENRRSALGKPL